MKLKLPLAILAIALLSIAAIAGPFRTAAGRNLTAIGNQTNLSIPRGRTFIIKSFTVDGINQQPNQGKCILMAQPVTPIQDGRAVTVLEARRYTEVGTVETILAGPMDLFIMCDPQLAWLLSYELR